MTQLDEEQCRAMRFFESISREGIFRWFRETDIARAAFKNLGHKLAPRDGRRADDSEA
jgi:hypothetical protein